MWASLCFGRARVWSVGFPISLQNPSHHWLTFITISFLFPSFSLFHPFSAKFCHCSPSIYWFPPHFCALLLNSSKLLYFIFEWLIHQIILVFSNAIMFHIAYIRWAFFSFLGLWAWLDIVRFWGGWSPPMHSCVCLEYYKEGCTVLSPC